MNDPKSNSKKIEKYSSKIKKTFKEEDSLDFERLTRETKHSKNKGSVNGSMSKR